VKLTSLVLHLCVVIILACLIQNTLEVFVAIAIYVATVILITIASNSVMKYVFRHPNKMRSTFHHPDWKNYHLQNEGHSIPTYSRFHAIRAPLVILIHGWTSSSKKMLDRANLIFEKGFHTIMFDYRGHGAAEPSKLFTAEIQVLDLKYVLANLHEVGDVELITSFSLYGHSLGGFIALGFSRHYHPVNEQIQNEVGEVAIIPYASLILESPMTSYNLIMEQDNNGAIKILMPILRNKMKYIWAQMHPHYPLLTKAYLEVPTWGMPECPVLIVQAKDDSRLGRQHFDHIIPFLPTGSEAHLLEELTHTGSQICQPRDELVINFLQGNTDNSQLK